MLTYNEAKRICQQSDCEKVCISVETWAKGSRRETVEYSVWDGSGHFYGQTLEIAMHGFMAAHPSKSDHEPEPTETTAAVFAEIGGAP